MSKDKDIKWTKQAVFAALQGKVSESCIVKRDGKWVVQGKKCILSPLSDGTWDLWICNPDDMCAGLHQKSVNCCVERLQNLPQNGSFAILGGEAYTNLPGPENLVSNPDLLVLLGIRRRRDLSDLQKAALLERLINKSVPKEHEPNPA